MPWLVQSVRLSLFVTPDAQAFEAPGWQALTDAAPARQSTMRGVVTVEEGPFGPGRLQLQAQHAPPPRIDLLLGPGPSPEVGPATLPVLGTFDEGVKAVRGPAERLLQSGIATARLALGVMHVQPARDWADAARIVEGSLGPTRLDLANAQDFLYRVNRRRTSGVVAQMPINRLAGWSCQVWQEMLINVASGQSAGSSPARFSAALETDFSTDEARREPIGTQHLLELLGELQKMTLEVANQGDIP